MYWQGILGSNLACICIWLVSCAPALAVGPVDFGKDVAPILERHCVRCHNERDHRGGLSLASAEGMRAGGESGAAIVPDDPDSSYLLDLVTVHDGIAEMPKHAEPLAPKEVDTLHRWIEAGAKWPSDARLTAPMLWSLQAIVEPAVPQYDRMAGSGFLVRSPIDAFVARRLQEAGLATAPEAERSTLIRRLYLDITGLPPTPRQVESFVADDRPLAYEQLVDGLLASPHFGERWGRHWLDLARYADSEGYLGDAERPHAWVYREWVISAFNSDQSFKQFTIEQIAGDLLERPTLNQQIATGFHRNTLRNTEAGVDRELYRTKEVVDRVNTTGMVWLGLTLGCAECHDHKHDPISQAEFYQLYAFFNNTDDVGVTATRPWEKTAYARAKSEWQREWEPLWKRLQSLEKASLTPEQLKTMEESFAETQRSLKWDEVLELYQTSDEAWKPLKSRVDAHWKAKPVPPNTKARAFEERVKARRKTFVHVRGVYNRPGDQVHPGTPAALPSLEPRDATPNRRDLAVWLFDSRNPLTARVAVNRIWQHLFGRGLVATVNDFGRQGAKPTHPQLLDWLANEYRRSGWSRKAMIRMIVNSSTYRRASAANAVPSQRQVSNQLLWRQNSFRVSAELVRDLHLSASGLLDRTIGRRGIRPPLPEFVTEVGRSVAWPVSTGGERYRRGMYIFFKRTVPYPMLMTFDAPDAAISCSRRERSNTPLQALTLLNDPVFFECASALGDWAQRRHPRDPRAAIALIFHRCLGRSPTRGEAAALWNAYNDLQALGMEPGSPADDVVESRLVPPLTQVARIVMNADEFITRN